jgi:hypothetical protein
MVFQSTLHSRVVIAKHGVEGSSYYQAGDANMKPCMVVTHDDADEVKICTSGDTPFGIIGCDADHDFGTVYALGERIPVWELGCGIDIYVMCGDTDAIVLEKRDILESTDDAGYDGHAKKKPAYLTTAERSDTSNFWIGRVLDSGTVGATETNYVPVKLSL